MLKKIFFAGFFTLMSMQAFAVKMPFVNELNVFAPFVGTWKGVLKEENGKPVLIDVAKWERALNGKALRTLHSINNGEYGGESLIFFDKAKQQIVFYYFTTADFYTQGSIKVLNDHSFVAFEDVTGNADGITQVKSTSTLSDNLLTVSTSYLKKGHWTAPETRIYKRSNDKVIFH